MWMYAIAQNTSFTFFRDDLHLASLGIWNLTHTFVCNFSHTLAERKTSFKKEPAKNSKPVKILAFNKSLLNCIVRCVSASKGLKAQAI